MRGSDDVLYTYYRSKREEYNAAIFDLEAVIIHLAKNGLLYPLLYMEDICDAELILINHYTKKYQGTQLYDFAAEDFVLSILEKEV